MDSTNIIDSIKFEQEENRASLSDSTQAQNVLTQETFQCANSTTEKEIMNKEKDRKRRLSLRGSPIKLKNAKFNGKITDSGENDSQLEIPSSNKKSKSLSETQTENIIEHPETKIPTEPERIITTVYSECQTDNVLISDYCEKLNQENQTDSPESVIAKMLDLDKLCPLTLLPYELKVISDLFNSEHVKCVQYGLIVFQFKEHIQQKLDKISEAFENKIDLSLPDQFQYTIEKVTQMFSKEFTFEHVVKWNENLKILSFGAKEWFLKRFYDEIDKICILNNLPCVNRKILDEILKIVNTKKSRVDAVPNVLVNVGQRIKNMMGQQPQTNIPLTPPAVDNNKLLAEEIKRLGEKVDKQYQVSRRCDQNIQLLTNEVEINNNNVKVLKKTISKQLKNDNNPQQQNDQQTSPVTIQPQCPAQTKNTSKTATPNQNHSKSRQKQSSMPGTSKSSKANKDV